MGPLHYPLYRLSSPRRGRASALSVPRVLGRRVRWRSCLTESWIRRMRRVRTLGHHRILRHHWISRIFRMTNWFTISVIHVLHWIAGHWNVLGFIRSSAPLLASLVKITTGTHEATDHSCNCGHKEQDR